MKPILFKPFERYSERQLLIISIPFILIGTVFGYFMNIQYNGVLDVYFIQNKSLVEAFIYLLINVFSLTLFLYLLAKYINIKARLIDIITVSFISRIPLYLFPLLNIGYFSSTTAQKVGGSGAFSDLMSLPILQLIILLSIAVISIILVIWSVVLLYNGFKVACNAKGEKAIAFFIGAIILSELLSKTLIYTLI